MWNLIIGIGIGALVGLALLLIYESVTSKKYGQIPSPYGMIDIPPDSELRAGRDAHRPVCECENPKKITGSSFCMGCGDDLSMRTIKIAGDNDG